LTRPVVYLGQCPALAGTPTHYGPEDVTAIQAVLAGGFAALGGLEAVVPRGARVVIKPNAGFGGPPGVHTTDPRVFEALVRLLQAEVQPVDISVVESAAEHHMLKEIGVGRSSRECLEACGLADVARRLRVRVRAVEEEECLKVGIPRAAHYREVYLPRAILEADCLIYVPHMKTHMACGVTLGIKLGQGCLPHYEQRRFHRVDLAQKLVDLLHAVRPRLTVVDGLWAQQGQGPTSPYEADIIRDMNTIVMGTDVVAVDAVGSAVMGYEPFEVPTTWLAHVQGHGEGHLSRIDVRGASLERVRRVFRRPDRRLAGIFPNVQFFLGGACEGCLTHLRIYLDQLHAAGMLNRLSRPVNVAVGYGVELPEPLEGPVLVVGDCTAEHRHRGTFVGGCCPLSGILKGLLTAVAEASGGECA